MSAIQRPDPEYGGSRHYQGEQGEVYFLVQKKQGRSVRVGICRFGFLISIQKIRFWILGVGVVICFPFYPHPTNWVLKSILRLDMQPKNLDSMFFQPLMK